MAVSSTSTGAATRAAAGEVLITRVFDAPRELVFKAWTDPEHLVRWYAPRACSLSISKIDVRQGGVFHYCIRGPEGRGCWCMGIYREIVEPERLVYSLAIADEKGNLVAPAQCGMDPDWPGETIVTVTFEEHEGKTRVALHQTVLESIAKRTGAHPSWIEMLDRLAEDLALRIHGGAGRPRLEPRRAAQAPTRQRQESETRALSAAPRVGPHDPRYADLVRRGFNKRFTAKPDYVRVVGSTEQVVDAVQEASRDGLRIAARSGGHCLEGFVADPAVRVVIDTSLMTGVYYDPEMAAFAVEAGATLGEVYRKLFLGWGVTVPAGESPNIGAGGHVSGGAFGFLCRQHGLAADHLYGVEVVVVDGTGTAKSVVATREASDPNQDLWWAHTGGGGGNFGIVTRYWFRSPGACGGDPVLLLPKAPGSALVLRVEWSWEDIDEAAFSRLVRNFGAWCERNSDADIPNAALYSLLSLRRRQYGKLEMKGVSTAGADAERLFDEQLAAISDGVGAPHTRAIERSSWLAFALDPFPELFRVGMENALFKVKDALFRKRLTDRQIEVAYHYLTRTDYDVAGGSLGLATYGGRVNSVAPDATATAQRDSILDTACSAGWGDPRDEARALDWVRAFYRDLFADTGGVPVPGEVCDGALINHPDVDLADPELNASGVPWHTLYYKDNYPRLQRIKARWDPRNVFRHALSIRPA